jgi:hypothetical protein
MKLTKYTVIEAVVIVLILTAYQAIYGSRPSLWLSAGIFIGVGLTGETIKTLLEKKKGKEKEEEEATH